VARTENDSWDLATSVGATATMVASARARATRAALIDDRFAEPLVRAVGIDFFTRWASGELDSVDVDVPAAAWGMQRMTETLAARTRYIDAFFSRAGNAGIRQVVILASGLDARAYRLPSAPGTTVYEIDQHHDVATYLADRGWRPVRTPTNQLLADNGLPLLDTGDDAPFSQNYYCTAVLHKAG
jgi:O-methyltransferase involved in polyketide biosynthesis